MKVLALALLLTACGAKLENNTTYRVEGEATVRVVVGVDVTPCEGLNEEDKAECIKDLTDLAKVIAAQQSASESSPTTP